MTYTMPREWATEHPTEALACFVGQTDYADLPQAVVSEAKRLILDVVGNALAGSASELGAIALDYVSALGGKPECTVIGLGEKTSALNAAYANSRLGDALDATDILLNLAHVGCPPVAAALAFSEQENTSGKDLITAVALGFEVGARLAMAVGVPLLTAPNDPGALHIYWLPLFEFAAAASAGKAMRLDEQHLANAFAVTGSNASLADTWWWELEELPSIKYSDVGMQASVGASGALLAKCGLQGYERILDGDRGLWKIRNTGACDFDLMVGNLGEKWYLPQNSYKPWPSCRWTHHPLTAFTRIIKENEIKARDIERVLIRTHPRGASPRFANKNPSGMVSCEFNQPHAIAMAAFGIKRGIDWYSVQTMSDCEVRALRLRVDVESAWNPAKMQGASAEEYLRKRPTSVYVTARGRIFEGYTESAAGDPWEPETYLTDRELQNKFRDLGAGAHRPNGDWQRRLEEIIEAVDKLEEIEVADLTRLLRFPSLEGRQEYEKS